MGDSCSSHQHPFSFCFVLSGPYTEVSQIPESGDEQMVGTNGVGKPSAAPQEPATQPPAIPGQRAEPQIEDAIGKERPVAEAGRLPQDPEQPPIVDEKMPVVEDDHMPTMEATLPAPSKGGELRADPEAPREDIPGHPHASVCHKIGGESKPVHNGTDAQSHDAAGASDAAAFLFEAGFEGLPTSQQVGDRCQESRECDSAWVSHIWKVAAGLLLVLFQYSTCPVHGVALFLT